MKKGERKTKLKNLMSPCRIGNMNLRNRIVMTAMGTSFGGGEGFTSEREIRFYEERAKGGVGLIITAAVSVSHPSGVCFLNQMGLSDDKYVPGLKKLVDGVHKHGAKIAAQLQHPGQLASMDMVKGIPLLTPSVPEPKYSDIGTMHDLTAEESSIMMTAFSAKPEFKICSNEDIEWVVEKFYSAAERAKRIGFDAIEIHAGHGYLIHSFLNPAFNKRTDEYGGSVENRARLLIEIIKACKKSTGEDFPLICKMDAITLHEAAGITLENAIVTAKMVEAAGGDAIFVTAYGGLAKSTSNSDSHTPQEPLSLIPYARRIKAAVSIPVIGVGRIEPREGDKLIGEGSVDFVAMGRQLLADPELPNKVRENRIEEIRPCIVCFKCISQIFMSSAVKCTVNPICAHEGEIEIKKAAKPKHIFVIGGGPAGMEAARVAAIRGHNVTLCEKDKFLGGTLFFASIMYPTNYNLAEYLGNQVRQHKVDIKLGVEVTPEYVRKFKPDAVIIASGVKRVLPDIPGIKQTHVLDGDNLRNMVTGTGDSIATKSDMKTRLMIKAGSLTGISRSPAKLSAGSKIFMPLGKNIVIIGGGLVGVEMAGFLSERKRNVTIIEEGNTLGWEMSLLRRWIQLTNNINLGVKSFVGCKIVSINKETITFYDKDKQEQTIDADNVIITKGISHNLELADALLKDGYDIYTAGDCSSDNLIEGAMADGLEVGLLL